MSNKLARQESCPKRKLTLSERMARIRKTDTKPEMIIRRLVHGMGYRYRLHQARLPGNPDIVLARHRKLIFVNGCFWHRHDCPAGRKLPRSKPEYWGPKLAGNRKRDDENVARLKEMGWEVLVIWECELAHRAQIVEQLRSFLESRVR
ncbi:MAG: DNA mismatch endonuclease Vsr [Bradyrhizobium sp.]